MRDVMSRCGALGSERPRASFKTNNLEQDLTRLLKSGNVEQHRDVLERKLASSALAGGHFHMLTFFASFQSTAVFHRHFICGNGCTCTHQPGIGADKVCNVVDIRKEAKTW